MNIWDKAISATEYEEYKNRELYGNIVSSEDLTTWVTDYYLSPAVRIPSGMLSSLTPTISLSNREL